MMSFDEFIAQNRPYTLFIPFESFGIPRNVLINCKISLGNEIIFQMPYYSPLLELFKLIVDKKIYDNKKWTISLDQSQKFFYFADVVGIPYLNSYKAIINYEEYYNLDPICYGVFIKFDFKSHCFYFKAVDDIVRFDPEWMELNDNELCISFKHFSQFKILLADRGIFLPHCFSDVILQLNEKYYLVDNSTICLDCHIPLKYNHKCRFMSYYKCSECGFNYCLHSFNGVENCCFCNLKNEQIFKHPIQYYYTMNFNNSNSNSLDKKITFQSYNHLYFVKGLSSFLSVTTFIHKFFEPFEDNKVIQNMSRSIRNPESEYFEKSEDDIKQMWQISRNVGTFMHLCIEHILLGVLNSRNFMKAHLPKECELFCTFCDNLKLEGYAPYRTEWRIYDVKHQICGSIDAIFIKNNEYYMFDWKRSKKISKYGFKWGLDPIKDIPDSNYYHYSLQLNLYRYILEQNYGLTIKKMTIVVIHPRNSQAEIYEIDPMDEALNRLLLHRRNSLEEESFMLEEMDSLHF